MDASAGAGAGNASACCYYTLLGILKTASSTDIRAAYRRLALKWHPDRWASDPGAAGEAKQRFQRIQEAYSVLSDKGKRAMYDAGLFDPLDDDDQDFSDFMQEMLVMMDSVNNEKPDTLEDLQKMLEDIVNGDGGSRCGGGGRVPSDGTRSRAVRNILLLGTRWCTKPQLRRHSRSTTRRASCPRRSPTAAAIVRLWKVPMLKMVDTNDAIGDASQPSAVYTWKHAFWGVDHQWDGNLFATVGAQVDIWDHNRRYTGSLS